MRKYLLRRRAWSITEKPPDLSFSSWLFLLVGLVDALVGLGNLPVVLPAVGKGSKSFSSCTVGAFSLSVTLGVVGRRVDQLGLEGGEDVLPKAESKVRASVGQKAMREAVVTENVLDEDLGCSLCGQLLSTNSKTK